VSDHQLKDREETSMPGLEGKVALITGGARGFGRAIACALADDGADVAIADIAEELPSERVRGLATSSDLERTKALVEARGRRCVAIRANVTNAGDCERMAGTVIDRFGKIDILAANAGVFSFGLSWELTEDDWDTVLGVNLKGVWLTTKYVVPHMIRRRYGKIVVTSSRDGLRAEPNYAHYCASKYGAIGFVKSLAIELGPFDINVNAICPTQMADKSLPPRGTSHPYWSMVTGTAAPTYAEFDEASGRENLFERGGQPDYSEVAEGVRWLVSDHARLVTGHALPMDAGWIAKRGG
jgi:NAD(P)-dependent dehydrogenase (short-subunit alcohol dehydrogenase family)